MRQTTRGGILGTPLEERLRLAQPAVDTMKIQPRIEIHPTGCLACADGKQHIYRSVHEYIPVVCFCGKMKGLVVVEDDGRVIKCERIECIERIKKKPIRRTRRRNVVKACHKTHYFGFMPAWMEVLKKDCQHRVGLIPVDQRF